MAYFSQLLYGKYSWLTPTSISSIFDPHCSALFSQSLKKSNRQSPQNWIFDSQMLPPTQSCLQFLQCSHTGATLRNATASPDFLCTRIALQNENNTVQKTLKTMVTTGSQIPVQKNSPNTITRWILTMSPIAQKPLCWNKKYPFSPEFMKCMNLQIPTRGKKNRAIFDPADSGLSPPPSTFEVRARECFLWVKNKVSSMYLHLFGAEIMKHSAFLFNLTQCSCKHITINQKNIGNLGWSRPKGLKNSPIR